MLFSNLTVRCKHHRCANLSVYIIIVDIIMQILLTLLHSKENDILVHLKLFRLYILPMVDIVIQRCDLVSKDYCTHVFFFIKNFI